jgi:hypothetical protein
MIGSSVAARTGKSGFPVGLSGGAASNTVLGDGMGDTSFPAGLQPAASAMKMKSIRTRCLLMVIPVKP